jgi:hypothetical protein
MCPGFPSLPDAIEAVQERSLSTAYTVRYGRLELPSAPTSLTQELAHAFTSSTYVELVTSKSRGPLELTC